MKTKTNFLFAFLAIALLFFAGLLFAPQSQRASADNFVDIPISDQTDSAGFSMRMTANLRNKNTNFNLETVTQKNETTGEETQYYVFKWRELESLTFRFTANDASQSVSHSFLLTHVKSETLLPYIGEGTTSTLYESHNFLPFNFFYYIDSGDENRNNPNSSSGQDFGLYKFDFSYTFLKQEVPTTVHKAVFVAVLPDTVEEAMQKLPNNFALHPSVGSKRLMTIYNITLPTIAQDALKFVNPARLKWEVVGKDADSINYCLDEEMQQKMEYGNYKLIYTVPLPNEKKTGTNFVLDSNNIEGNWNVSLYLEQSDGEAVCIATIENLSTFKAHKALKWWLILLIVLLVLLAIGIVATVVMIVRKKKEKVW